MTGLVKNWSKLRAWGRVCKQSESLWMVPNQCIILTYQINLSFHQNQHKIYDSDVLLIHEQQSIKSILFISFVYIVKKVKINKGLFRL